MFDFAPLYRSTVGFDRLAGMLDRITDVETNTGYPPYNIERISDDEYRITMAVAGFGEDDLNIEVKEQTLTVSGRKAEEERAEGVQVLHRGIATRGFDRRFQVADHVEVTGAGLENGLLHITLKREIPEAMKSRTIRIAKGSAKGGQKTIGRKAA